MREIDLFPLWLSLQVAAVATLFVVLSGVALAWLLARKSFFGREALDALVTLPLVLPPTVLGYYLLILLGRNGPAGRLFEALTGGQLVFTLRGAVVAASVGALPLMLKTARAAIASVDTQFEDAARTLGKSEWQVFRYVTLPLASRGILAGAMLAFARSLGDFGATLMVAGNIPRRTQTASIAIYDAVQAGRDSQALALVALLSLSAFALLYATNRLVTASLK
ncbi:MAG TPA: molybdate ABC transporter permease subunit [Pyrinomonadaceae bacterium]|jgi:molybdate transport system permease protein|nr:molybdate ABC transporter permease subunit [Pyrinomonadaceae bacterium]